MELFVNIFFAAWNIFAEFRDHEAGSPNNWKKAAIFPQKGSSSLQERQSQISRRVQKWTSASAIYFPHCVYPAERLLGGEYERPHLSGR